MKTYGNKILALLLVLVLLITVFAACEKQKKENNQSTTTSAQTETDNILSENQSENTTTSSEDTKTSKNSSLTSDKNEDKSSSSKISKPSSSSTISSSNKCSSSHQNTTTQSSSVTQNTSSNVDLKEYKLNYTYSSLEKAIADYIDKNGTGIPENDSCVVHKKEKIGDGFALLEIPDFRILSLTFFSAWNKDKVESPHEYFFSTDGKYATTEEAYNAIFKAVSAFKTFSEGKAAKYRLNLSSFDEPFIYDNFEDIPTKYLRRLSTGNGDNYFRFMVDHPESTVPAIESGISIRKEGNGYYVAVYYDVFFDFAYHFDEIS